MKLMFCILIKIKVFYKLILLFLMGLAKHSQSTRTSLQCLCDILRKKLSGSNTTLTIYYTSNVLPPLNLFLSQYGIHIKPFLDLIIFFVEHKFLAIISSQVGPCKLACQFILETWNVVTDPFIIFKNVNIIRSFELIYWLLSNGNWLET